MGKKIILFYNNMWDQSFEFDKIPISEPFSFTTDRLAMSYADVVVFHMPSLDISNEILKKDNQLWVFWSMECEVHYAHLYQPYVLDLFDIFMTYKLDSDISVLYLKSEHEHTLRQEPAEKFNLINNFVSSSFDKSGRTRLLGDLMSLIPVHSYGKLFNNRQIVHDSGIQSKKNIISTYKFTLSLENAIAKDYVTEKFFDPLIAGSIPVYLGAPNVDEFAPGDRCYININSFNSTQELADYLIQLDRDDKLYQEYFFWKKGAFNKKFMEKLNNLKRHPFLKLCDLVVERLQNY